MPCWRPFGVGIMGGREAKERVFYPHTKGSFRKGNVEGGAGEGAGGVVHHNRAH